MAKGILSATTVLDLTSESRILEAQGRHEEAERLLSGVWAGAGHVPDIGTLPPLGGAALLLRAAVVTGFVGGTRKIPGANLTANRMLRDAVQLFKRAGSLEGCAEAVSELAYNVRRLGRLPRARRLAHFAAKLGAQASPTIRAAILLRLALVENADRDFVAALKTLQDSAILFDAPLSDVESKDIVKLSQVGIYFNFRGLVYRSLAIEERNWEYFDAGYTDITAAQFFFSRAGHKRYEAAALNNMALFAIVHRDFVRAHEYVERARQLLTFPADVIFIGQVEETRARIYAAERRFDDAERVIEQAVAILQDADEPGLLSETLVVRDTIFAARDNPEQADKILIVERPRFRLITGGGEKIQPFRDTVTFRVGEGNASLEHLNYYEGSLVPFEVAFRAHEGQFVLARILPGGERFVGFYHVNAQDKTVMIDTGHPDYDHVIYPSWRVQVCGVHRTLQRLTAT
jgi:tetratricopeptide (TPR) repeat protein